MDMLDLFCCEGIGALGYDASMLFKSITGVDIIDRSKRYPYEFILGSALQLNYEFLGLYDFIHASPPCQAYSKATHPRHKAKHERLIAATHQMLYAAGKPYVIENVEGSGKELRPNLVLSGHDVGLPMERRRYFYVDGLQMGKKEFRERVEYHFMAYYGGISPNGKDYVSKQQLINAYRLQDHRRFNPAKITKYGIEQGIPPRMTMAIANIMFGVW